MQRFGVKRAGRRRDGGKIWENKGGTKERVLRSIWDFIFLKQELL